MYIIYCNDIYNEVQQMHASFHHPSAAFVLCVLIANIPYKSVGWLDQCMRGGQACREHGQCGDATSAVTDLKTAAAFPRCYGIFGGGNG